jgi:hypothetical protein
VRFSNALFNFLAMGKKGAEAEPGDGQLVIPAVLQPQAEIPAPILTFTTSVAQILPGSHIMNTSATRVGAQVAGNADILSQMAAGLWRLDGVVAFAFTGTVQPNGQAEALLVHPDASTFPLATFLLNSQPVQYHLRVTHCLHLIADGAFLRVTFPATVAGDTLIVMARLHAGRLLV